MLLDWAQILKGSGFFCPELSVWSGAGASAGGYSGSTCVPWLGDAVCRLRWLETLCWELFWLSFLSSGCCKKAREGAKKERWLWLLHWAPFPSMPLFSARARKHLKRHSGFSSKCWIQINPQVIGRKTEGRTRWRHNHTHAALWAVVGNKSDFPCKLSGRHTGLIYCTMHLPWHPRFLTKICDWKYHTCFGCKPAISTSNTIRAKNATRGFICCIS